jgi:cobalt-precorrin-7 (C5)-methyltransferase
VAKFNIIGVGPGSPDYVTPAARRSVQEAQLVVGAKRSLDLFSTEIKGESCILTAKNLKDLLQQAAEFVNNGKNVVLLSTGDPGFSGLLHTVLESGLFRKSKINVVPGVSSIQVCAARINLDWTNANLFSFHDEVSDDQKKKLVSAVKSGRTILLLPNPRDFTPKDIANFLIDFDVTKKTPAYVCENLTLESEKITMSTLEKISTMTFGSLCVMVIKRN